MSVASLERVSVTPTDLTITPRDRRFGREDKTPRWWLNDSPYETALFNALSATFPKGEAYFIESIRAFRDAADDKLAGEIRAFTTQEVIHSREHVAFNRRAADSGYDLAPLERKVQESLDLLKGRPPILDLAATMALEHFTAIIAHELLANPRHLANADQATADLWRWHAVEEIEHKGVAYDTWLHATKDWSRWKRWKVKSLMMVIVSKRFIFNRVQDTADLLAQDGLTGWKWRAKIWAYLLVRPGFLRRIAPQWLAFFMPGFHPWNHDDRALIAKHEGDFTDALLPA